MPFPPHKFMEAQENYPTLSSGSRVVPPRPPRTAFMCYADAKKEEIMSDRQSGEVDDDILAIVAAEWRSLDESDRATWDEVARDDKVRYVREKAEYKGPWVAPKRRAKKHPLAPKRPMSAFLKFSQNRRAKIKEQNPDMGNTDVSRLLGEMWRNASENERRPYIEQELLERAQYNEMIKKFREQQAALDIASRTSHQTIKTIALSRHQQFAPIASQLNYDPLSPFEPLRIHRADEVAERADQRFQIGNHPFPVYAGPAYDKLRHRPMFRPMYPSVLPLRTEQPLRRSEPRKSGMISPSGKPYSFADSQQSAPADGNFFDYP